MAAVVWTNARRENRCDCASLMGSPRRLWLAHNTKADKGTIGKPPLTLGDLGIALVPAFILLRAHARIELLTRRPERPAANHQLIVFRDHPLGGVPQQIVQPPVIRRFAAH